MLSSIMTSSSYIKGPKSHPLLIMDMEIDQELMLATVFNPDLWWTERQKRITASRFGKVMSARNEKSLETLVQSMRSPRSSHIPYACRIGLYEEENAKLAYINYMREVNDVNVTIIPCGLCVPTSSPHMASTPDGIVQVSGSLFPHVLEIKCIVDTNPVPQSICDIAKQRGSRFYCKLNQDGSLQLKKNHQYYYQVLGEMATTGLLTADFVIYHPRTKEIKVIRVTYDGEDWKKLKNKLDHFIYKYLDNKS